MSISKLYMDHLLSYADTSRSLLQPRSASMRDVFLSISNQRDFIEPIYIAHHADFIQDLKDKC